MNYGIKTLNLIKELYPICRSLTGKGNRETLKIINKRLKSLKIIEIKSGTKIFDWTVPPEWEINDSYIILPNKKKIAKFKDSNLHILNYSHPINKTVNFKELKEHLFTIKKKPNLIPYVTSYYKKKWGFCITHNEMKKLKEGKYKVFIDSKLNKNGSLSIGQYFIKGKVSKTVLITSNICHPSLVNNELSGPCLATTLAEYLSKKKNYFSYKFVFFPETIGSLCYIKKNFQFLKKNFIAGYHLTCLGGKSKEFSIIKSKEDDSYSNKIAILNLKKNKFKNTIYSFLKRGSDERQFNAPGINLPVVALMRKKFGNFREYHNSSDNLSTVNTSSLNDCFEFLKGIINTIENDYYINPITKGEPFMQKRNLYNGMGLKTKLSLNEEVLFNILAYCDHIKISELCEKIKIHPDKAYSVIKFLEKKNLLRLTRK